MSEVLWYYEEGGRQAGPISHAAMAEAIQGRRLPPGSRVWRAGLAGWQPWEAVAELAAFAPAPPQAAAPPMGPPPGYGSPPGQPQGWGAPQPQPQPQPPGGQPGWGQPGGGAMALYPKAPLGARFIAYIVDWGIAVLPVLFGYIALAVASRDSMQSIGFGLPYIVVNVAGLGWALWYFLFKDSREGGQSIGKKARGLMVVHLPTNTPCSRGQSAARALVMAALGLIPFVGGFVEPIVTLASDGGRRLGDKAAGTQVIAASDYRPRR